MEDRLPQLNDRNRYPTWVNPAQHHSFVKEYSIVLRRYFLVSSIWCRGCMVVHSAQQKMRSKLDF